MLLFQRFGLGCGESRKEKSKERRRGRARRVSEAGEQARRVREPGCWIAFEFAFALARCWHRLSPDTARAIPSTQNLKVWKMGIFGALVYYLAFTPFFVPLFCILRRIAPSTWLIGRASGCPEARLFALYVLLACLKCGV